MWVDCGETLLQWITVGVAGSHTVREYVQAVHITYRSCGSDHTGPYRDEEWGSFCCRDQLPCSTNTRLLLSRDKFCGCVRGLCMFGSEGRRRGLIEIGAVLSRGLLIGWGLSPRQLGLIAIQLVRLRYVWLRCGTRWWSSRAWEK